MYSINSTELNRSNRNRKFLQSKSKMYFLQQGFNLVFTNFNIFVPCFSETWIQLFWVESFQNFATNFTFEWLPSCNIFNIRLLNGRGFSYLFWPLLDLWHHYTYHAIFLNITQPKGPKSHVMKGTNLKIYPMSSKFWTLRPGMKAG